MACNIFLQSNHRKRKDGAIAYGMSL